MPLRITVCGLVAALSEKLSVALSIPTNEGVNVTLTEHFPKKAIVASLQAFALSAKSAAFIPESVTAPAPRIKSALPLLVIVVLCGALLTLTTAESVSLEAESVAAGAFALGLISNTVPKSKAPPNVVVP